MTEEAHLWVVGFDNTIRAEEVRKEIAQLAGPQEYLQLLDLAVVVRWNDGSLTCEREAFPRIENIAGSSMIGLLVGLVVGAPLVGATIGGVVGSAAAAVVSKVGIDDAFIGEVGNMIGPGTSALFVLDNVGDLEVILNRIRGLGGTILKTNVDLEQAKVIQSALSSKGGVVRADA
jgi:uncharacterized membrane protein